MNYLRRILSIIVALCTLLPSYLSSLIFTDSAQEYRAEVYDGGEWFGECLTLDGENIPIDILSGEAVRGSEPRFDFEDRLEITLDSGGSRKFFNYFCIAYRCESYLRGHITYFSGSEEYAEEFFLESCDGELTFRSFIDAYRDGGKAREISSLSFENLTGGTARLTLGGISMYNREAMKDTIYITNDFYRLGVCLEWGGALSYLEYLKDNVQAVKLRDGDCLVGPDALKRHGGVLLSSNVNLINRYDAGRLIQQSYYGTEEYEDYQSGIYTDPWSEKLWPYNPVQGGNLFADRSKIVDWSIAGDGSSISIKCRPMDWAKNAEAITPSYMEAVYTLSGKLVLTDCRFVDYSGYRSIRRDQELPAFYAVEPLNCFVTYNGSSPWSNGELEYAGEQLNWGVNSRSYNASENWSAWTNGDENSFGIALYVPDIPLTACGVYLRGKNEDFDKRDLSKCCPTSYMSNIAVVNFQSFKPLEYSYMFTVGALNDMRSTIYENRNIIDNDALLAY